MVRERLKFYQIYYDDSQTTELYSFAHPYKNQTLTPFFENSVIVDLVPTLEADLISVCSWALRRKRGDCPIQLQGRKLTKEKILQVDFDVAVLTPRSPRHKPMLMASHWHGTAWDNAIKKLREFMTVPKELNNTIYENHFITRGDLYKEYVDTCLSPVMDFMGRHDVFFADSGYIHKIRRDPDKIARVQKALRRNDWPIAPFILERLFSIWIDDKDLKVIIL